MSAQTASDMPRGMVAGGVGSSGCSGSQIGVVAGGSLGFWNSEGGYVRGIWRRQGWHVLLRGLSSLLGTLGHVLLTRPDERFSTLWHICGVRR